MRYFLDTEFESAGLDTPIYLISIALVAEDGRTLYRENINPEVWVEDEWVIENVLPHLRGGECMRSPFEISCDVQQFVGDDRNPEFWGYYSDFDWVIFTQLMGGISLFPSRWPYFCRDLRQSLDDRGHSNVMQPDSSAHNALDDALWVADTWKSLVGGDN